MKIQYETWKPTAKSIELVELATEIIDDYEAQGYTLTLRQLYYQFIARDTFPNTKRSYDNLVALMTRARLAGLVSWYAIEDRLRVISGVYTEEDESELIGRLEYGICFDHWARQDYYIEVWVEKEALGNIVSRACEPYDVRHMSCKGYMSASAAWAGGRRFMEQLEKGKECMLIHLGDHDPSGLDMTRDNGARVDLFSETLNSIDVRRIALNMDQVEKYNPPPNFAKTTDSRYAKYITKHGSSSWELDALEPSVIVDLIQENIKEVIDDDVWEEVEEMEKEKRKLLRKLSEAWPEIKETL